MKRLRIHVEGKTFEVEVELLDQGTSPTVAGHSASQQAYRPPASVPIQTPTTSAVSKRAKASGPVNPGDVTSPLSAVVVSIDVSVGDTIEEGQQVVTLEAMKMNTIVNATQAGTVKAILAQAGDAVEEGQVILSIE